MNPERISPTEFAAAMAEIAKSSSMTSASGDPEEAHQQADDLMVRILKGLGYAEGVEHFLNMTRWYA